MTIEEINEMPAGPEMNQHIAQLLGYTVYHYDKDVEQACYFRLMTSDFDPVVTGARLFEGERKTEERAWLDAPDFSTDIAAAWQVVEEAKQRSLYPFFLTQDRYGGTYSNGLWLASFRVRYREYEEGPLGDDTDAMDYWNLRFGEWKEDPTLPFGGYCPSSTGPAKGNIAAANTPALAICKARLLAHFCPIH